MSRLLKALEDALVENPDDLAGHAAYADLLMEAGDPRGEFIQVQLGLEDASRSTKERAYLRRREQELLQAHEREWLGGLADHLMNKEEESERCRYQFARGWLDRLAVGEMTVTRARALAGAPQTRLLRELGVDYAAGGGKQPEYEPGEDVPVDWDRFHIQFFGLFPLVRSPFLSNIRRFRLGNGETENDCVYYVGAYPLGHAAVDLIARMPRIEEVCLFTMDVDLDRLFSLPTLTHLRVLQVHHMSGRHPLEKLAENPALQSLTHLLFHPHLHEEYRRRDASFDPETAYLPLSGVQAILRSSNLPSLTHLQLRLCSMGDPGCQEIVLSGILKLLKVLDLWGGCITDNGARILAECPDLRQLERLDIGRNALTPIGISLLTSTGIAVESDRQLTPAELEEAQFLFEGEFE